MKLHSSLRLQNLTLNNFATFEHQTINFNNGLNIIVGETGSGKSLLFDALNFVFGSRSDKSFVRTGCSSAIVEARFKFDSPGVKKFLDNLGFPADENEIFIKRIIQDSGKSKAFLNFQRCKIQTLTDFSKAFIDLIGQFENQRLLTLITN